MSIRIANTGDFTALGQLMYDATRQGDSPYTDAQRAVWMPVQRSGEDWNARLCAQYILLSETDSAISGFMSLTPDGYVDFAYIATHARGQGLFRRLYSGIETEAKRRGLSTLTTHASLMAAPAFTAMGFDTISRETVEISGQSLPRYFMRKLLNA